MLNGCRVDVRHAELALGAVDVEASKKLVSIYFYRNHNYRDFSGTVTVVLSVAVCSTSKGCPAMSMDTNGTPHVLYKSTTTLWRGTSFMAANSDTKFR